VPIFFKDCFTSLYAAAAAMTALRILSWDGIARQDLPRPGKTCRPMRQFLPRKKRDGATSRAVHPFAQSY
jgi:hypothetical protein